MNEAIAIMIVLLGASFGVGWIAWVVATNIRLKHFVEAVTIERANPFGRILGAVQVGLILTLLGLAFLLMRMRVPDSPEALLMFGAEAGPVRNRAELQRFFEAIVERLQRLYEVS